MAHDIGHLPFSHAAERKLLPAGEDHEHLTIELVASTYLSHVWDIGHRIRFEDVQKLAVGQKKLKDVPFSTWESILSEIIIGDSFGVDRMDYLLRDSFHCGVSYGKFDHLKLINSLRILPKESSEEGSSEPTLGVELSGLHSAEAMLLARYFMYEQVYFHPVRRIYDKHLVDFAVNHYGLHGYKKDLDFHLSQTDNELTSAIRAAHKNRESKLFQAADAILCRRHFRWVYSFNPTDQEVLKDSIVKGGVAVEENKPFSSPAYHLGKFAKTEFGEDKVKTDLYIQDSSYALFPVIMPDGRIEPSIALSPILKNFPLMNVDSVYVAPELAENAKRWLEKNRSKILRGELK